MISPTQAARTATPWMTAQCHGRSWAARWLYMTSDAMPLPSPWESTVNSTFQTNGTQSW